MLGHIAPLILSVALIGAATANAAEGTALPASGTDSGVRPTGALYAGRSASMAMHGMAATSHALATQVALDILKKGGSAVDAAIAANAMLSFAEPMMCGPGGDLFAIVWDPQGNKLHGLNGSGRSARSLGHDELMRRLGAGAQEMPVTGGLAVTVPGAVDGWFELHRKFGRLPMAEVLAPAVAYAREGVPTPPVIALGWQQSLDEQYQLAPDRKLLGNLDAIFAPGGRAPAAGEIFRNPVFADFLERLGREGRDYVYRGDAARRITEQVQRAGGSLAMADLAAHAATWVDPVSTRYRGHDVFEMPPNGQGTAVLQALNILQGYDLAAMGRASPDFWHLMLEAKKLAYEDRARHYADPDFMRMPLATLLSDSYAAERRGLIDMRRAMRAVEPGAAPIEKGDTVYLAVADGSGMMVSLIQSTYYGFGSGLVPDGLGFALQNRGTAFALDPAHPNVYAPGKRPFHTIIPAFVMKDGKPLIAFGLMGGAMQAQGHVQVLVNMIDFGMDLQDAGDAARFNHDGSSEPGHPMTDGGTVYLEPGVTPEIVAELRRRGHSVKLVRDGFGGYEAIRRDPATGVLTGATERRKDGSAAGY